MCGKKIEGKKYSYPLLLPSAIYLLLPSASYLLLPSVTYPLLPSVTYLLLHSAVTVLPTAEKRGVRLAVCRVTPVTLSKVSVPVQKFV